MTPIIAAPMIEGTKAFDSLQMKDVAVVNEPVDAVAAARRLSNGVKFPTISEQTYPLAHKALKREVLGDPRQYSLLYTWRGTNPAWEPIILMGH